MGRFSEQCWLNDANAAEKTKLYKRLAYHSRPLTEKELDRKELREQEGIYTPEELRQIPTFLDLQQKELDRARTLPKTPVKMGVLKANIPLLKKWLHKDNVMMDYVTARGLKHSRRVAFEYAKSLSRMELMKEIVRLQDKMEELEKNYKGARTFWYAVTLSVYKTVGGVRGSLGRV